MEGERGAAGGEPGRRRVGARAAPAALGASPAPAPSRCCEREAETVPGLRWRAAVSGAGLLRCPFTSGAAGGFGPCSRGIVP